MGGTIEVDETFVGGVQRGHQHKAGHPECKKEVVIGIRQRGGELRFFHAADVKSGTLAKYIKENISQDVDVIMTDEFASYPKALHDAGVLAEHKTIRHKDGIYVDGDIYTNTVESAFSLLSAASSERGIGFLQSICKPTLRKCEFRFNNRQQSLPVPRYVDETH